MTGLALRICSRMERYSTVPTAAAASIGVKTWSYTKAKGVEIWSESVQQKTLRAVDEQNIYIYIRVLRCRSVVDLSCTTKSFLAVEFKHYIYGVVAY